jgi:hypothetical protein
MPGNPLVRFDEGRVGRTARCRPLSYSTGLARKYFPESYRQPWPDRRQKEIPVSRQGAKYAKNALVFAFRRETLVSAAFSAN